VPRKKRTSEHPSGSLNPVIQRAYYDDPALGWYYPWDPPKSVRQHSLYKRAVSEGWADWIETPLDWMAVEKGGFGYDLSRDVEGNPCYWIDGHWQMSDGSIVEPGEDEEKWIAHVGRGDHFCRFGETFLYFTKDPLTGQPYRFLDWSRKLCSTLFGWVSFEGKRRFRRYRDAYIAVAKKNSKSDLVSVMSIYMMRADFAPKSYCYCAACDRNQAGIVYNEAASYVRTSPYLNEELVVLDSRNKILHNESASRFEVLSSDSHRNDGLDANFVAFDELHRQPNRKLWAILERSGQARPHSHLRATITTYGPSVIDGSIWAEVHQAAKAQLEGRDDNYRKLVWIASAEPIPVVVTEPYKPKAKKIKVARLQQPVDLGPIELTTSYGDNEDKKVTIEVVEPARRFQDYLVVKPINEPIPDMSEGEANLEWRSDHAIKRANPSVGVIFETTSVWEYINNSHSPDAEAETKQLNLNICSGSGKKFISAAAWNKCNKLPAIKMSELFGKRAFGAMDISFSNDLFAFSIAVPSWDLTHKYEQIERPLIDLLTWVWVPEDTLDERQKVEEFPYRAHMKASYLREGFGSVRSTPGKALDFTRVAEDIFEICSNFKVQSIAVDPNFSGFVVPVLEEKGYVVVAHRQGGVSMAPPTKRFSELVHRGILRHQDNPALTRAVNNAVLHPPDRAGNTYPSKTKSYARIDPLISGIMAVGHACNPPMVESGAYSGAPGSGAYD
jgi:phage terminase large subunit-like protein